MRLAFGAYSYGANHGVCKSTKQFPKFLKYLNMFLTRQTKTPRKWTSLVVNINNRMPMHRDVHNQVNQPNVVIGLGKYEQGGLWVQETVQAKEMGITGVSQGPLEARTTPHGEVIWGRSHETRGQVVEFPPKAWHETEEWSGERIVLSAYTPQVSIHSPKRNCNS